MAARFSFVECCNPNCGFRFPLDLCEHQGKFCPRCASRLGIAGSQIDQHQPAPLSTTGICFEVVLDNIRSVHNVGSIFRTAESVGVDHLYLCGLTPNPKQNPALAKASLGAEMRVGWSAENNAVNLVARRKQENSFIIALESTPTAQNIFTTGKLVQSNRITLVLGSEPAGIDPGLLALSDLTIYIPMSGKKSSLNVSVAFGIAAYTLLTAI